MAAESTLRDRVVLVVCSPGALRDRLAAELACAGTWVLLAGARGSALRLLASFRVDAVVCVVGSPTHGLRLLPDFAEVELRAKRRPMPACVAVDLGGAGATRGFAAVVRDAEERVPIEVRARLADLAQ